MNKDFASALRLDLSFHRYIKVLVSLVACIGFGTGCQTLPPPSAQRHLTTAFTPVANNTVATPPPPTLPELGTASMAVDAPRFSIAVNNLPIHELLAALTQDAKLALDIHAGVNGRLTLHATQQTITQILDRICHQLDLRYELKDGVVTVMPDTPYLRHYRVDYVNLSRNVSGAIAASTQIAASTNASTAGGTGSMPLAGTNISSTRIEYFGKHHFWENLEKNIKDLLRETDKLFPEGSSETTINASEESHLAQSTAREPITLLNNGSRNTSSTSSSNRGRGNRASIDNSTANLLSSEQQRHGVLSQLTYREAASVIIHPESGIVSVRATAKQQEKVAEFINQVLEATQRQVMIEATIVEVELSDGYQQGIEWSRLREDGSGFQVQPAALDSGMSSTSQPFILSRLNKAHPLNLSTILNLLKSFGATRVLSSPRLSVLNNQTALLKVVENFVYFNVKADTVATANAGNTTTVTTTPQSVSVGLVMSVTPQISETEMVTLNVRPSVSSIVALKEDPNPGIPNGIKNLVPQIRVRELESVLRIAHGDIAVLGGLMEDSESERRGQMPLLGEIPLFGEILTARQQGRRKSELVILLRPVVIKHASLQGDYAPLATAIPLLAGNPAANPAITPPRQ